MSQSKTNPPWPRLSPAPTPVMQTSLRTPRAVMASTSAPVPSDSKVNLENSDRPLPSALATAS